MPRGKQRNAVPIEWEKLTTEQQQGLIEILQESAQELRDQYEEELTRLQQQAAAGQMLARHDTAGFARPPVPPVPDVKRDGPYEKLALDTHRLVTYLAYLDACLAHLSTRGYDIGIGLSEYLAYHTDSLPEGRVKAAAKVMEQAANAAYTGLYTRTVTVFPERAMHRLLEWDESARQQDSWVDRLRRLVGEP